MMYLHPAAVAKIVAYKALECADIDYNGMYYSSVTMIELAEEELGLDTTWLGIDEDIYNYMKEG